MFNSRPDCILLQRLAVVGSESVESEETGEIDVYVKLVVAIRATATTFCMAQLPNQVLYIRIIMQNPGRRNGPMVRSVNQSKRIGKLLRILLNCIFNIGMLTNLSTIIRANMLS